MADYSTPLDTYSTTTYLVKLAQDAKIWERKDGKGIDVSLTFADNSRIEGTETLWVDANVLSFQAERASKLLKGDEVMLEGKLRFKRNKNGELRGRIFDARFSSFAKLAERSAGVAESVPVIPAVSRPAFE